jgi:formylglycine-generating enzyme required for sulfatase activity
MHRIKPVIFIVIFFSKIRIYIMTESKVIILIIAAVLWTTVLTGTAIATCEQEILEAVSETVKKYDPDGDGKIGLEVAIHALQVVVGIKQTTVPDAPNGLKTIAGESQVIVSWNSAEDCTYIIYWNTTGNVTKSDNAIPLTNITGISCHTHTDRSNGITYYYRLAAFNSVGESELSVEVSATPAAETNSTFPQSIVLKDIPGGTFIMGGTTVGNDAQEVNITLSPFKISEKEITNTEYIEFLNAALSDGWVTVESQQTADPCGTNTENMVIGAGDAPNKGEIFLQLGETGGCTSSGEEEHIDNKSYVSFNATLNKFELLDATKGDWPVNWVKWYGAYAFVEYYDVSLPSEAQWEYAARGGQQLEYPTDDGTLSLSKANYNGDSPGVYNPNGHSVAVGSYPPNPYGLYDMGGNVWEWCQDYYDADFYTDGETDPINTTPGTDSKRVRRGGSWNYHSATLLTYARASDYENRGNNHFGFRIVKSE